MNALSQVLRIRHPRSSSPAVLCCAIVCALLVCVGVAQGKRRNPPLVLALNTCRAACDILSCCCMRTQSTMPINPSILLYLMNRSAQPQYGHPLPLLLPNADRVRLVLPPATNGCGTLLPLHSFALHCAQCLRPSRGLPLPCASLAPVTDLPCGPQNRHTFASLHTHPGL